MVLQDGRWVGALEENEQRLCPLSPLTPWLLNSLTVDTFSSLKFTDVIHACDQGVASPDGSINPAGLCIVVARLQFGSTCATFYLAVTGKVDTTRTRLLVF
jgi:hypothetical protein